MVERPRLTRRNAFPGLQEDATHIQHKPDFSRAGSTVITCPVTMMEDQEVLVKSSESFSHSINSFRSGLVEAVKL